MGVPDKPSHRTHTDTGSAGLADTGQPPVECRVLRRCDPSPFLSPSPPFILHLRDTTTNIQEVTQTQARVFTVSSVFITEVYLVISMYHYSFFSAVVLAAAVFQQTTTTSYFSF